MVVWMIQHVGVMLKCVYLGFEMAVKSVVQPRHERAHYQYGDAAVVELGEQLADELRVAVDRMEHAREEQAGDGAQKERAEHHLLLYLHRRLAYKVDQYT